MSPDDALTTLRTLDRDRLIDTVVREYAATRADLRDLGISDHRSRQVDYSPRPLNAHEIVDVPLVPDATDPLVALVPTNTVARQYVARQAYLRAETLRQRVRLAVALIGGSDDGVIEWLHPVIYRARIGSAAALHNRPQPIAQQVVSTPNATSLWPDEAAYLELAQPVPLGLRLGFAPSPPEARRHYLASGTTG